MCVLIYSYVFMQLAIHDEGTKLMQHITGTCYNRRNLILVKLQNTIAGYWATVYCIVYTWLKEHTMYAYL